MKPCKAKLPNGTPCPHMVDEGQVYCPFHLASQDAVAKNIIFTAVLDLVLGIGLKVFATRFSKVSKIVANKKL